MPNIKENMFSSELKLTENEVQILNESMKDLFNKVVDKAKRYSSKRYNFIVLIDEENRGNYIYFNVGDADGDSKALIIENRKAKETKNFKSKNELFEFVNEKVINEGYYQAKRKKELTQFAKDALFTAGLGLTLGSFFGWAVVGFAIHIAITEGVITAANIASLTSVISINTIAMSGGMFSMSVASEDDPGLDSEHLKFENTLKGSIVNSIRESVNYTNVEYDDK